MHDFTSGLLGILLRFRKEAVAIATDIQQLFYNFHVYKEYRNYLRFLWYNDFSKPLVECKMCEHVFGNSLSSAIATYNLRRSVEISDPYVK